MRNGRLSQSDVWLSKSDGWLSQRGVWLSADQKSPK